MYIPDNSFQFGKYNSLTDFGIKVISQDIFTPEKRLNTLKIPFRHGDYKFKTQKRYYNPRILTLNCYLLKKITKDNIEELDEIKYHLSKENQIRLWNDPEKYYIGELYQPALVDIWQSEDARNFTLDYICEPFKVGATITQEIQSGSNKIDYKGTAETPALIVLKNPNNYPICNVTITITKRK